jgi:LL-diaminopimelate aminotransferase
VGVLFESGEKTMREVGSQRLNSLPPYLFAEIDRKKRAAKAAGRDIIDFGVGDPDRPTHAFIIERMNQAIRDPANHVYPFGGGSAAFRRCMAVYFERRYGVQLDAQREILALIGSKEGIGHLPLAVVNPGDVVLVPSPGYPVYYAGTVFAGGQPHIVPLTAETGWLPDFGRIPADVARRAVLMFINYPNNPTGATATLEFYARAVAFAQANNLLLAQDAAYNEMYLGQERPPSILQVPGAKDVAIEFHSASKTFNMTGWRIGFAVGNAAVLAALAAIKANFDSGVFGAVQDAACSAYEQIDRSELHEMRELYRFRATALCAGLQRAGFEARPPQATFYIWARVPAGYDSMRVCERLLDEANVVVVPGSGFGPTGEGYVRFALSVPNDRMQVAIERMGALQW